MEGIVGRFFYQFGVTVAFAVMISLFVSFTLDPMLSARLLRKPKAGKLYQWSERSFAHIEKIYEWLLSWSLRWRKTIVALSLLSFVAAGYIATFLRSEFIPMEDQSEFNIKVKAPLGASLGATDDILERIRHKLEGQPWLDYSFATIGADELQRVNEGTLYVKMFDKDKRPIGQLEAMAWTRGKVADIRDAKVSVEVVPRISGGGRKWADVQMELRGPDLDRLEAITSSIMDKMRHSEGYVDLDTTYEKNKPEANVYIKRDRAAALGVTPLAIATTVKALIGGNDISKFKAQGERYDISVRFQEPFRNRIEDIESLTVRSRSGKLVNLRNVARVREEVGPVQIDRYNRTRQITILANLIPEKKVLGQAVAELTGFARDVGLPAGYSFGFAGFADEMGESFANLFFAFGLAVAVVYMLLASQFESFVHPLTIMFTLPLSLVGAFGALVGTGMTVSIYTMIGLIMLMGLVTKNGILLVDYTNTLRTRDGVERNDALLKAGPIRLRPILMTSMAVIFGMLPIAVGTGAGSESRAPMAVAVIGGLVASTLLTLVVVPVVYTLMDDLSHPSRWRVVGWFRKTVVKENTHEVSS